MSNRRRRRAQLRSLECLAYSSSLSYLRTLNESSDETVKSMIEHLRPLLNISSYRHRAEMKRIVNDEDLERLASLKHCGTTHLNQQWIEMDEKDDEHEQKVNSSSSATGPKKKFKAIQST